jgi:cell division septation protein DedD
MDVDALFIADTVGKNMNKVIAGPFWSREQAEAKLERLRGPDGDKTRFRIREATIAITFKDD